MSRKHGRWKIRFSDMHKATQKILEYTQGIQSFKQFAKDSKSFDACIRNFQILGDAAKKVPLSIRKEFSNIPWKEISGMRDILVHEYFGTDSKIIWKTIKKDLPSLEAKLSQALLAMETPAHDWKVCPPGETFVSQAQVSLHTRKGSIVKEHLRSSHCRESETTAKSILSTSEIQFISEKYFSKVKLKPNPDDLGYSKSGNMYDLLIAGWTEYWNKVFKPKERLDTNVVKALIATESSFIADSNKGKRRAAKGLMQLMPSTLNYLRGESKELNNHIFEFDDKDVFDPGLNISLGTRWLFRKHQTASARLGREASWDEAVAEYKDYLRRKIKNPKARQKGMEKYFDFLKKLRNEKKN